MHELDKFLFFLKLYVNTANKALEILKTSLQVDNPMCWRQLKINRAGKIGPKQEYEYNFHGTDCRFSFRNYEIDFEFGFDGRVGGFNSWKLFCFSEDGTKEFTEFRDEQLIEDLLKLALEKGLVNQPHKKQQDYLFYLK